MATSESRSGKSPQQYIDESPFWHDGTDTPFVPITQMQMRIWYLATAGQFFGGLMLFITGVAMPLMTVEFSLNDIQKGLLGSTTLFGILVGATSLGGLSDTYGRKRMFIIEMAILAVFLTILSLSPSFSIILIGLFGAGLALGCDYPTAHIVISESMATKNRGKLVLGAFGFQAIGALAGTGIGYIVLANAQNVNCWRIMYATIILPVLLVMVGRFFITRSAHWLMTHNRVQEAEEELTRLLHKKPMYPQNIKLTGVSETEEEKSRNQGYKALFSGKNRRATLFAAIPWFLQDMGTYGIGLFTPTILAATFGGATHHKTVADVIHSDLVAAKGATMLDLLLIIGIVFAVLLSDRVGRVKLQIVGFIGCAAGLVMVAVSENIAGTLQMVMLFAGFMLFNFMANMGPNSQTYLIAGEVFPTKIRAKGAGFAASTAKTGAVLTAFFFPILLQTLGTTVLLAGLAATSLLGALITWKFGIETKGVSLEDIGK